MAFCIIETICLDVYKRQVQLGFVDRVLYFLRKREQYVHCEIFSDVEPNPSVDTVYRGAEAMRLFLSLIHS